MLALIIYILISEIFCLFVLFTKEEKEPYVFNEITVGTLILTIFVAPLIVPLFTLIVIANIKIKSFK